MNIPDDLTGLLYPVADLHELPGNPRRGDVEAVKRSYERFGQRKPIVARRDDDGRAVVVAGNHQLKAVRELGWEQVAVVWADDLSEDEARGFALADNRTADIGEYDDAALVQMLSAMDDLAGTGYSEDDLADLVSALEEAETQPENGDALAALGDVTLDAPLLYDVAVGDVWRLGNHVLVVAEVMTGMDQWASWLSECDVFAPYPGVFVPLTEKADAVRVLMVQPDAFLAGHVVTKFALVKGKDKVAKL